MTKTGSCRVSRREWFKSAARLGIGTAASVVGSSAVADELPLVENGHPRVLEINHDPQFFVDDYLVDNRWGVLYETETVLRVFHPPQKYEGNPVISGKGGYVNVVCDDRAGLYRMIYQASWDISATPRKYTYATAYAESTDGLHWKLPRFGRYMFDGTRDNNIVMLGPNGGWAEGQFLLDIPEEERRGHQLVLLYGTNNRRESGMHLIGSHDGIEWDWASDMNIMPRFEPDTQNSIVWDPQRQKYVMFTRATDIYTRDWRKGLVTDKWGPRRRVARLEHSRLWDTWPVFDENILIPDELDAKSDHNYFYGMPTRYYAGIYWGFLWPFGVRKGDMYVELVFSRDGRHFQRLPERPRLIDLGTGNAWDRGMLSACARWVEVGDEWWIYYTGHDQGHNSWNLRTGVGLARLRKEGFVSLRSPAGGGGVVTKMLRWPGGNLYVNADASQGDFTVKITNYHRRPLANFNPPESLPMKGNSTRHEVKWKEGEISRLKGDPVRLEFYLNEVVDLYGFRAVMQGERP